MNNKNDVCLYKFVPYDPALERGSLAIVLRFHAYENYTLGMLGLTDDVYAPTFPAITLIHQSFELYLKAILSLNNEIYRKKHDVMELYDKCCKLFPELKGLFDNEDIKALFIQFSQVNFVKLRYGEGKLVIANSKSGDRSIGILRATITQVQKELERIFQLKLAN